MAASCVDRQKAANVSIEINFADTMKTFDSFESWYKGQMPKHKRVIARLRNLVSDVAPKLLETSKWTNGVWQQGDLPLIFIHIEPDHMQFGFFGGASLNDPKKLLKGKGKHVRHIRVEKIEDVDEVAFAAMIRKAVRAPSYKKPAKT